MRLFLASNLWRVGERSRINAVQLQLAQSINLIVGESRYPVETFSVLTAWVSLQVTLSVSSKAVRLAVKLDDHKVLGSISAVGNPYFMWTCRSNLVACIALYRTERIKKSFGCADTDTAVVSTYLKKQKCVDIEAFLPLQMRNLLR